MNQSYTARTRRSRFPLTPPIRPYQLFQLIPADLLRIEIPGGGIPRFDFAVAEVLLVDLVGVSVAVLEEEGDVQGRAEAAGG